MVAHSMQCTSTSDTASIVRLAQVASHQVRVCNTVDDLHKHWCCKDVLGRLRHSQIRDPVLDVLAFVLKALLMEINREDRRRKVRGRDEPRRADHGCFELVEVGCIHIEVHSVCLKFWFIAMSIRISDTFEDDDAADNDSIMMLMVMIR